MRSVSIIIAAYHAESTIERAIASALAEAETGEVIVVDDASTDNTAACAQSADDGTGRLRVLVQARNAGPAAARNRALSIASQPWVGILDADDYFLPGRLAALLAASGAADLVADDMWQEPEDRDQGSGISNRTRLLQPPLAAPHTIDFCEFVLSNVTRRGRQRAELGFIKPLFRLDFLRAHGLRYREHLRLGEDFELYARALALGARLVLIPAAGYVSVVRAQSLSGQHTPGDLCALRDCAAVLQQELALTPAQTRALDRHERSIDCRLQWRLLILAVKHRQAGAALACFRRPWPVPLYLATHLLGQLWQRTLGRLAA